MKSLLQLIAALALILSVAACGNDKAPARNTSGIKAGPGAINQSTSNTVKLMTWRYLTQDKEIIRDFETKYSVKVDVKVRSMVDIIADAVAGTKLDADVLIVPTLRRVATLLRRCLHQW
jgi:ABC-type glycerol-3-phosphate transport system substrate-binding protein